MGAGAVNGTITSGGRAETQPAAASLGLRRAVCLVSGRSVTRAGRQSAPARVTLQYRLVVSTFGAVIFHLLEILDAFYSRECLLPRGSAAHPSL